MEEFATHTNINWSGNVGTVEYGGGDRGMVAIFYARPMQNPVKSREHGRPFYEDRVYVRIHPPGERLNIIDREVTDSDKRRWPVQWNQFVQNRQQTPEGTPIDLLYPDYPSIAAMLRANGVHTIEQLSDLSANAIETIGMGSQRYVNDAKKYLETAQKGVGLTELRHELEERDSKIRTLEHTVELLKQQLATMQQESQLGGVDLASLQRLIVGAQQRPEYPQPPQFDRSFDVQSAQIAATHPTVDVKTKRKRAKL